MYETERAVVGILIIYLVVLGVLFLGWLAAYILQGIGMYTIGKRKRMSSPWLAFVPFARVYFQGELAGTIQLKKREIKTPGMWLLLIPIVGNVVSGIIGSVMWGGIMSRFLTAVEYYGSYDAEQVFRSMFAGTSVTAMLIMLIVYTVFMIAVQAAVNVLKVLINQQVYTECTTKNMAILHAVLGVFIPLYTPIYYFIIRNRIPEAPVYYGYNPYPPYPGMQPGPQMNYDTPVPPQPEEMHQEPVSQEVVQPEEPVQEDPAAEDGEKNQNS